MGGVSSRYDSIISKSVRIQSGSPAVYQLKPKRQIIGSVRKMTLGERNVNQINKTILLVGETGAGKSALVDTLVNYTMGVKWEDNIWFKIVEEEKGSRTESQTSDVIVYQIFGYEGGTLPYSLTVIDTPGYGDTRGAECEDVIRKGLSDLLRSVDGVYEINAVGLVLKATENRLNDRLRYVFDSLVSLFGKDVEKNIVPLITHTDRRTPENALKALHDAQIKCTRNEKNQPVHFMFSNCQITRRTETNIPALKTDWDSNTDKMKSAVSRMDKIRDSIRCYRRKEPVEDGGEHSWFIFWSYHKGATICEICQNNCHDPCYTPPSSPSKCSKIKNGRCTACVRKCSVSEHKTGTDHYVD